MISGKRRGPDLSELKNFRHRGWWSFRSRAMSSHNTFRYERALIPPRVGESAAIISSDEIPEWRRRRRGEAYRHAHVPFRNSSSLTSSRPQRCATHLRGAATLNTFQRRDEFCKRVLHICIAPPRPSTKPFQGDYARVCANDCDTQTSTTTLAVQWCPRRERGRERLETGRPAGWQDSKSRREGGVVHCQYPTFEFTSD